MIARPMAALSLLALVVAPVVVSGGPARAADCAGGYTVRQGDTLEAIAESCGASVEALLRANPEISDPGTIAVGVELAVPGAAPEAVAPAPASGRYTVEAGDSMARIASRFGLPLADLLAANETVDPGALQPGQELMLPETAEPAPEGDDAGDASDTGGEPPEAGASADAALRYTVASGDSMARIASRFGVPLADLLAANETVDPGALQPGQELVLPATSGAAPEGDDAGDAPDAGGEPPEAGATAEVAGRYTVEAGDSMARIASRLGLPLADLLAANETVDPGTLQPGQELVLPPGVQAALEGEDSEASAASGGPDANAEDRAGGDPTGDSVAPAPEEIAEPVRLVLEGRIEKGDECPVLRAPDGRTFGLVSQTHGFTPGDYVAIEGEPVDMSFCKQGRTVRVTSMTPKPAPHGG